MPRQNKVRSIASEAALARRIEAERNGRDLTYEALSGRMASIGCPIDASALYRIEKGKPRRRITVDELVGFSRVFNIPVSRLLLPPEVAAKKEASAIWDEYETTRRKVANLHEQMQRLEARLLDLVDTDQREAVLDALHEEAGDELALQIAHMRMVRGYGDGGEG